MKKNLFLLLVSAAFPLFAAPLMTPDSKNFNCYGNASQEKVVDEGRPAVRVRLGGVNDQRGGALQIFPDRLSAAAGEVPDGVSLLLRGDGDDGSVVVLLVGDDGTSWCWNGQRWEASAAISCSSDIPRKLVLKFSEFRKSGGPSDKIDPARLKSVHIGIGPNLTDPSRKAAGYYLYSVLLEKGAAAVDELPAPAPAAEDVKKK